MAKKAINAPFTAVVAEITASQIILTEDERLSAIDDGFVTTTESNSTDH